MTLLAILLLFVPLIWELINDRNGEAPNEKTQDIFIRLLLAITAAVVGWYIAGKAIPDGVLLSLAIHFVVFDYAITWILKKRKVIETKESAFSYLGKSWTDDVLRQWKPMTRFLVKLGVLVGAVIMYIL
jgi:undecaprenyl pyrophosphate phosphatase UppP